MGGDFRISAQSDERILLINTLLLGIPSAMPAALIAHPWAIQASAQSTFSLTKFTAALRVSLTKIFYLISLSSCLMRLEVFSERE